MSVEHEKSQEYPNAVGVYNRDGERVGRLRAGRADRVAKYILSGDVIVHDAEIAGEVYVCTRGRNKGKVEGFLMSVALFTTLDVDDPEYITVVVYTLYSIPPRWLNRASRAFVCVCRLCLCDLRSGSVETRVSTNIVIFCLMEMTICY